MVLLASARRTTARAAREAAAAAAQCACPVVGYVSYDDAPPMRRRSAALPRPAPSVGRKGGESPRSVAPEGHAR
jgi:hypothetical protein